MTTVWAHAEYVQENVLEVVISLEDAPRDFLGVSFHLNFDGVEIVDWRYESGAIFDEDPWILVAEKDNVLITGMAFSRGKAAYFPEGNLITFSVQVESMESGTLSFDYPVLSRFENGRKDVETVEWRGSSFQKERKGEEELIEELVEVNLGNDFQATVLTYPPKGFVQTTNPLYKEDGIWIFATIGVLCGLVSLGYLYYRYRKRVL